MDRRTFLKMMGAVAVGMTMPDAIPENISRATVDFPLLNYTHETDAVTIEGPATILGLSVNNPNSNTPLQFTMSRGSGDALLRLMVAPYMFEQWNFNTEMVLDTEMKIIIPEDENIVLSADGPFDIHLALNDANYALYSVGEFREAASDP